MGKYTAFISYRHLSPDADIAKKLHSMIENFGIPGAIKKKTGMKKMGRVFRDQDELPLSADLGDDIRRALEESDWLICVCSPRYPESRWCMEEVRYFLSMGKRDHILTILTAGEPEESFPEELMFQTVDGKTVEREPLAADVRADDTAGMLKKLKNEKLRILAPILGVEFDDLRQRSRRRRSRIIGSSAAAAMLLLSGFLAYALVKNAEITRKNEEITEQRNSALTAESKWLAQSAQEALDGGDRMLSMLLSLEALPEDPENPDRPVTDEAVSALRSAVISGTGDVTYQPVTTVTVPGLEEFRGVDNALYCFSRKSPDFITAYDMNNGQEAQPAYTLAEEPTYFLFAAGGAGFSIYDDRITLSNGYGSERNLTENVSRDHFVEKDAHVWNRDYIVTANELALVLLQKGQGVLSRYYTHDAVFREYAGERGGENFGFCDVKPVTGIAGSTDAYFLIAGSSLSKEGPAVLLVNVSNDDEDNVLRRYYVDTSEYSYPSMIDASCDGTLIAGAVTDYIYLWNIARSEPVSIHSFAPKYGFTDFKAIAFSPTDPFSLCVLTKSGSAFLFDCRKGEISLDFPAGAFRFTDFMWNSDGTGLLFTCSDGRARLLSSADGDLVQTFLSDGDLETAVYANADIFGNSSNDRYILLKGGDRIQVYSMGNANDIEESSAVTMLKGYTHTMQRGSSMKEDALDRINISADGSTIWNMRSDGLYVLDSDTLETKKIFREGFDTGVTMKADRQSAQTKVSSAYGRLMITDDLVFLASGGNIQVYDPAGPELLAVLRGPYPHVFDSQYSDGSEDRSEASGLESARVSENGRYILACSEHPGWFGFQKDPSVFVYRKDSFEELWHMGLDSGGASGERYFDAAKDWEGYVSLNARFLGGGEKTAVIYIYDPYGGYPDYDRHAMFPRKPVHLAFEVRDSATGETETTAALPYEVGDFWIAPEYSILIAQDSGYKVHVTDLLTGREIAAFEKRYEVRSFEIDEESLKIFYEIKETDSVGGTVTEVLYREGTVREVPAEEVGGWKMQPDGVFGDRSFTAKEDGLYDTGTGEAIMTWKEDDYIFLRSWDDGSGILCFKPYRAEGPSASKDFRDGSIAIIRNTGLAGLQKIALRILDGRTLTEEQKKKYFLK